VKSFNENHTVSSNNVTKQFIVQDCEKQFQNQKRRGLKLESSEELNVFLRFLDALYFPASFTIGMEKDNSLAHVFIRPPDVVTSDGRINMSAGETSSTMPVAKEALHRT